MTHIAKLILSFNMWATFSYLFFMPRSGGRVARGGGVQGVGGWGGVLGGFGFRSIFVEVHIRAKANERPLMCQQMHR